MSDAAERVIEVCEAQWPAASGDCSRFVREVAMALGVELRGNADGIVDQIAGPGWGRLRDGREAAEAAERGWLVIGGLRGPDHARPRANGHVVVVVRGPLNRERYPTAYWGQLGGEGRRAETINWSWVKADRDRVVYAGRAWQQA